MISDRVKQHWPIFFSFLFKYEITVCRELSQEIWENVIQNLIQD